MANDIPQPIHRRLRGYAFDPSFSPTLKYRLTNEVIYQVRWEKDLKPGPIGEYVEVIDYDPLKQCFYEPVDLNDPHILANQGLDLSDNDPRFHQQQVYAVVMSVIEKFEISLGRKIIFSRLVSGENGTSYRKEFVRRLRVYPHALYQQNAYYSPQKKALLFGYFKAQGNWGNNNIPGLSVFSCLSPDIVSHECTHAILDSMHPYLNYDTNPDMLAFHEGFADIIALLQRFSFHDLVKEQMRSSKGDIQSPENMLGSLAFQFGQALPGSRKSLRSYLVDEERQGIIRADPNKYHDATEPHERGAVLVATIFDAFARLYKFRTADLLRMATHGSGILSDGEINPDLLSRLSEEACKIAQKLLHICIRALDYCPPADLSFSDYLRALLTADLEHNPEDEDGLRYALMEAFRSWGIVPPDVNTYSLQSLVWQRLEEYYPMDPRLKKIKDAVRVMGANAGFSRGVEKILRENDRKKIFDNANFLAALVHEKLDIKGQGGAERLLGMNFDAISYELKDPSASKTYTVNAAASDIFQVHRCRPFIRSRPNTGETSKQLIITFLQKVSIDLGNSPYEGYFPGDKYTYRGGCTMIVDLASYEVKYSILKSVSNAQRLQKQLDYMVSSMDSRANAALTMQDKEPFAITHSH